MHTRRQFLSRTAALIGATYLPVRAFSLDGIGEPCISQVRTVTKRLSVLPHRWEWIVGHHSATRSGNAAIFGREHLRRGMENGLAYHFVIGNGSRSADGEIEIGRRWYRQIKGGHVHREDINAVGIGICLVGNFQETKPTPRQLISFKALVDYLRDEVVGHGIRFAVHREIDSGRTECPGVHFPTADMHALYGRFRVPKPA